MKEERLRILRILEFVVTIIFVPRANSKEQIYQIEYILTLSASVMSKLLSFGHIQHNACSCLGKIHTCTWAIFQISVEDTIFSMNASLITFNDLYRCQILNK